MKIDEGRNTEGELDYFEAPNAFLFRHAAYKVVYRLPEVPIVSQPSCTADAA
jgi:hypothetical protein